jgi:peptidoglycan hydrolase-like protein with peptidoglycan-binding domain
LLTLSSHTWTHRSVVLVAVLAALISATATRAVVSTAATTTGGTSPTASASSAVGSTPLRRGDRGPRVVALQELLVTVGFKTATNGVYGTATVKTVRKFQRASTVTVNGVANTVTLRRLKEAAGSATSSQATSGGGSEAGAQTLRPEHLGDRIPLRPGMSGQDVRVMQSFLRQAGFKAKVNGDFDKRTVRHVKAFERANESPNADGTLDANELAILRADVEGGDDPVNDADTTRTTPGEKAKLGSDGLAIAPESAPDAVKQVIAAGNRIAKKPYIYGGGHGRWNDSGYDCSGSVSYALHGAGLLDAPLPSGPMMSWGKAGAGDWITIYANGGHAYMYVAGLRFDTSGRGKSGSRWQSDERSNGGFTARHPKDL